MLGKTKRVGRFVMEEQVFTTNVGDYLVISITGQIKVEYIAEVVSADPLRLKVEENGPFSSLKDGDFIVHEQLSADFQNDRRNDTEAYLEAAQAKGRTVLTGLISLGIADGALYQVGPSSQAPLNIQEEDSAKSDAELLAALDGTELAAAIHGDGGLAELDAFSDAGGTRKQAIEKGLIVPLGAALEMLGAKQ